MALAQSVSRDASQHSFSEWLMELKMTRSQPLSPNVSNPRQAEVTNALDYPGLEDLLDTIGLKKKHYSEYSEERTDWELRMTLGVSSPRAVDAGESPQQRAEKSSLFSTRTRQQKFLTSEKGRRGDPCRAWGKNAAHGPRRQDSTPHPALSTDSPAPLATVCEKQSHTPLM